MKSLKLAVALGGLAMSILAMVMAMHGHQSWDRTLARWYYDPGWNWQALIGFTILAVINALALVRDLHAQ